MKSNFEIKQQIYSLRLSDEDTCGQIETFLLFFSFNQFTSLRSLTLTEVAQKNVDKLKLMLPLLPASCSIHLIDRDSERHGEPLLLGTDKYETYPETPTPRNHFPLIFNMSLVTRLTLACCSCVDLSQLFRYLSKLKYLNVGYISSNSSWTERYTSFSNGRAVHLKQLILRCFSQEFANLEMLVKQTPKLKSLMMISNDCKDMFDAHRWENLITSSIPLLTVFKFQFCCSSQYFETENNAIAIADKFEKFQSNFWQEQHHWYTEFSYNSSRTNIFTIPYMSNSASYDDLPKKSNLFDNITYLSIYLWNDIKKDQLHLKNVTELELDTGKYAPDKHDDGIIERECFEFLKRIINLSKLKHLIILQRIIKWICQLYY
jgi:hypothetical protein